MFKNIYVGEKKYKLKLIQVENNINKNYKYMELYFSLKTLSISCYGEFWFAVVGYLCVRLACSGEADTCVLKAVDVPVIFTSLVCCCILHQ